MADDFLSRMKDGVDKYGINDASHVGYGVRSYIELQYHGDLTLNDIDTLTVDKYILDEVFSDELLKKKVKEAGIKCNYILGDDIIIYSLD